MNKKDKTRSGRAGRIVGRVFISLGLVIVLLLVMVYSLVYAIANGPSVTLRDTLVNMAMQASATKWVPGLVLSSEEVDAILAAANAQNEEIIGPGISNVTGVQRVRTDSEGKHNDPVTTPEPPPIDEPEPEVDWSKAVDGIIFKVVNAPHCKAYVAIIKDPTRVYTATSSNFKGSSAGIRFWELAERDKVTMLINAGDYPDNGGGGNGSIPMGITYSNGNCVWDVGLTRTFIGCV